MEFWWSIFLTDLVLSVTALAETSPTSTPTPPLNSPEKYHLLDNNCNSFTNDVCQFLVGKPIPSHITSLPADFTNT